MESPKTKIEQIPLDFPSRPAMGREDFLVGTANASAATMIDQWPAWGAPAAILNGPAACGKSHLAAVWQQQSGAENINPQQLDKLALDDIAACAPHIVIDGVDLWIGDKASEVPLFHLYNMAKENGTSLLLTMRSSPGALSFALPDLASRLRAAPLSRIDPPDDDLLGALLVKQFYDRQLPVGAEVIQYILPRMERSFAAARDIVQKANEMSMSQKRPATTALMREVLIALQD